MTQHNPPPVGSRNYRPLLFQNVAAESDANTSQYVVYNRPIDRGACVAVGWAGSSQLEGLRGDSDGNGGGKPILLSHLFVFSCLAGSLATSQFLILT